jgi:hypothetical protein
VNLMWSTTPPHLCTPASDISPMLYRKEMQAAGWAHRKRGLYAAYLDHLRANVMAATQAAD